jgi:hypothetical protein
LHPFITKRFKPVQDEGKNFKKYIRQVSVDLLRAKVPHCTIRSQLKMLDTLRRVQDFENENVENNVIHRMPAFMREGKIRRATRVIWE